MEAEAPLSGIKTSDWLNLASVRRAAGYTGDEFGVAPKRVLSAKKSTPLSKAAVRSLDGECAG